MKLGTVVWKVFRALFFAYLTRLFHHDWQLHDGWSALPYWVLMVLCDFVTLVCLFEDK